MRKKKRNYPVKVGKSSKHTIHDDELFKINKLRSELGLRHIEKTERSCLKCDKKFTAYENSANFMCNYCGPSNIGEESFDY